MATVPAPPSLPSTGEATTAGETTRALEALRLSRDELFGCALPSWYHTFQSITFKTLLIPVSPEVLDYLHSDGVVLPEGCDLPVLDVAPPLSNGSDEDSDQISWSSEDDDSTERPVFKELVGKMTAAISELGGSVLPKLNWSAPRDVTFMVSSNSLKCTCPAEVFLLLKSSTFIAHDLSRAEQYCSSGSQPHPTLPSPPPQLAMTLCLRQWRAIHPGSEFRCFVHHSRLIAVSQRDCTLYLDYLVENKEKIRLEMITFFEQKISGRFPNSHYVFDVFREKEGYYWLVDFNPFSLMTDPLLFSWEELCCGCEGVPGWGGEGVPVVRVVEAEGHTLQPTDMNTFRLPKDMLDLTSGEDVHKLMDLIKLKETTSQADAAVD